MNHYEQILFQDLQKEKKDDKLLSGVRNALGSIAFMKGNPLTKTEISLQVTVTYSLGAVQIQPAALPAGQTNLPVYIFGLTDFYGGFTRCQNIIPPIPPWYTGSNIIGEPAAGIIGYTRNAVINAPAVLGDLVISWALGAFGAWTAEIVIHCNNVAYGTFLNSFVSDLITINTIRYFVPFIININQFINPIMFGYQTLFGKVHSDAIDPRMFITNRDPQQWIADIPVNLPIDKNMLCGFYLDVFCPGVSWTLFVEKVEPLTYKRK